MEEKPVTKSNCYFLFELAHEYQIASIAQKCEALMVSMVKSRQEHDVLAMLIYGQKYQLNSLISTCIYEARRLTLKELKQHKRRDEVEPDNYLQIAEGIIQRLEDQCMVTKQVKEASLIKLKQVSGGLYYHAQYKGKVRSFGYETPNTDTYLSCLKSDGNAPNVTCYTLCSVAEDLIGLKIEIDKLAV